MRKRKNRKQFWFNDEEVLMLRKKASLVGMSESSLIRCWVQDIYPKEKPPPQFFDLINELWKIGVNLNQIAHIANATHYIDNNKYDLNTKELKEIIKLIKEKYL